MRRVTPMAISRDEEERLRRLMAEGGKEEYRRYLAILLRAQGMTSEGVAGALGVTRRSVERWVRAYRSSGAEELGRGTHPGRSPRMGEAERRLIVETALKGPRAFGYLKNEWSVRLLARHLTEELGVEVSRAHLWRILRELGIVYKRTKAVVSSPDPDHDEKAMKVQGYKRAASALEKRGSR